MGKEAEEDTPIDDKSRLSTYYTTREIPCLLSKLNYCYYVLALSAVCTYVGPANGIPDPESHNEGSRNSPQ